MHIETYGHGPENLVLIHGWAMHSGIFAPLLPHLADRFHMHLVDLPGHGFSTEREEPLNLADCAKRIAEVTPPAVWLGWSLGGLVCLEAARQKLPGLRAMVLIAASPRFVAGPNWLHGVEPEVFEQFADGLRHHYHRTIDRFLALETHGSDHAHADLRELKAHIFERGEPALPVLESGLHLLAETDYRDSLAAMTVPTLWIAGRRDQLIPSAAMRWAAEQSTNSNYMELSAGHAPFLSQAKAVADALISFAEECRIHDHF